ncbi:hypothetical protein J4Q44_G00342870 [Coregonus suidteri]|uniref:Uncharacterized protein n=1 Tax=Coregonus suidteri TaxID=861788 RepID=A0AAN8KYL2_9TELE
MCWSWRSAGVDGDERLMDAARLEALALKEAIASRIGPYKGNVSNLSNSMMSTASSGGSRELHSQVLAAGGPSQWSHRQANATGKTLDGSHL